MNKKIIAIGLLALFLSLALITPIQAKDTNEKDETKNEERTASHYSIARIEVSGHGITKKRENGQLIFLSPIIPKFSVKIDRGYIKINGDEMDATQVKTTLFIGLAGTNIGTFQCGATGIGFNVDIS